MLDTNFAADLTIMEEASELVERITKGEKPLPQVYQLLPSLGKICGNLLSRAAAAYFQQPKSPIGMQGPTIKSYFAKKMA